MLVKITAGVGVGQIVDLFPHVAHARINGGTAVAIDAKTAEALSRPVVESSMVQRATETAARILQRFNNKPVVAPARLRKMRSEAFAEGWVTS